MPRASKRTINSKIIRELSDQLTDLITRLNKRDYINQFFDTFLTDEEKIMIAKRLMLHVFLEKGLTNSQISSVLSVSRQTVVNHKKKWKMSDELYRVILKNLAKKNEKGNVWGKIEDILYPVELMLSSKTNMRARAKLYNNDFERPRRSKS